MPPTNPRTSQFSRSLRFPFSRRRFLQASAAAISSVTLSNCARNLSNNNPQADSTPSAETSPTDAKTLYVYTWANYTDDELLQSFEEATGIKAIVDLFDSNETMLAKLEAGGGSQYSIVYPSDYAVVDMIDKGLLATLDPSRIQGVDNLLQKWANPTYDANNEHSIPTTWGTTGLIYDSEKLGAEIKGWDYLYDNVSSLTRRVTLINDVREVFGATLKYLGYPLNSTDAKQIQAAYNQIVKLKPTIASFLTNGWEDQLASGDLDISMAYSSDALSLIEENENLRYVIPQTGASIWTDTIAIPKAAPNADAAYQWINFILEPKNSASLVERLKFATPNEAAYELLPADLKNNTSLFPPQAILNKGEGVTPVSPEVTEIYDRYWTQLTSG
ncbi:MAG: spermidine/putrescine ABC transporter substrate-binding protein [Cyanobacteria bacterium CRU_2_1]|nr:spermidine/putrescine ABC transporter substrate-binding protein [Cyanobacteria bacterium RU_5_0]NJR57763.1 spermidine/putrescine ABC transporter substrate-binding protein [Cyanobacteria bacterium CRU_2_1]